MVKVKVEKKMNLLELIEWAWKNGVKGKVFPSSRLGQIKIDHDGNIGSIGWIFENDTFTVEVEEEITEETVFKRFYEYTKGQSFMIYENTSISKIKDEVSKEFWMKDGNTLTLIWKDGELVGDE